MVYRTSLFFIVRRYNNWRMTMNYKNLALKIIGTAFVMASLCSTVVLADTAVLLSEQAIDAHISTETSDQLNEPTGELGAAISGTCGDDVEWMLTSDGTLTISGTGYMDNYGNYGPDAGNNLFNSWNSNLSKPWNNYRENVKKIVISEGVKGIGANAFTRLDVSGELIIPNTVDHIGKCAFEGCEFTSIDLPDNIECIGDEAFYGCKATIKDGLPSSVRRIGERSFRECKFNEALIIPNSVEYIGDGAFVCCSGFYGTLSLGHNIEHIGDGAFASCSGFTGNLLIPGSVKYIGNGAFSGSGFDGSLTLEEGVEFIDNGAFGGTNFQGTVTIPSTAETSDLGVMNNVYRIVNKTGRAIKLYNSELEKWVDDENPQFIINSIGEGTAIKQCTVQFLSEDDLYSTKTVVGGTVIQKPEDPSKKYYVDPYNEYYVFDNWYETYDKWNNTFSDEWDSNKPVCHGMKLYAKFDKYWTVLFLDGDTTIDTQLVKDGDKVIRPKTELDDNPKFLGWTLFVSRLFPYGKNSPLYNFNTPVTSDYILCAVWDEDTIVAPEPSPSPMPEPSPSPTPEPSPSPTPEPTKTSIDNAKVTLSKSSYTYNGKKHVPKIKKIGNLALNKGTDYKITIVDDNGKITTSPESAGTYIIVITGKGKYTGTTITKFAIKKAQNPLTVKGRTTSVEYSKLKKGKQTIKRNDILSISKKRGKITYKKIKGNAKISIDEKTGKVALQKGLKKKTYSVRVKITAAGGKNYKKGSKTVTVKIQIK